MIYYLYFTNGLMVMMSFVISKSQKQMSHYVAPNGLKLIYLIFIVTDCLLNNQYFARMTAKLGISSLGKWEILFC